MARTKQARASFRHLLRLIARSATGALAGFVAVHVVAGNIGPPAVAGGYDACGPVTLKSDGKPWTCSYVDNFDGVSLDSTKWIIQETGKSGFRVGLTCFMASDKNIKVARGNLFLTARREPGKLLCKSPLGGFISAYTGGMIGTRTKFSQAFGKFEVRAKFPSITNPGVHGGFGMLPLNRKYGPWPASGEIDVAEWWSVDPTLVLPSLHYNGRNNRADSGWNCRVADPSNFHTYTVQWLPTEIDIFIDGALCFTRAPTPHAPLVAPQPFDDPFNMVLGMGVGSAGGPNVVSAATPLPATYVVDYAKAWR